MRNLSLFWVIGLSIVICCSEGFEGPELKPPTIPELYVALAIHYNSYSISGIKAFYSPSFRHNGMLRDDLDSLWDYRLGDGSIKIREIDVIPIYSDTMARCVLDVCYSISDIADTIHIEPDGEYGDVCFWKREGDYWLLYGNQADSLERRPFCAKNLFY